MIDIPQNTRVYDMEAKIDKAIRAVLGDSRLKKFGFSDRLCMNHATASKDCGEIHISHTEAMEIARRFKAKGYYAHFYKSIQRIPYRLSITTYPTDYDI